MTRRKSDRLTEKLSVFFVLAVKRFIISLRLVWADKHIFCYCLLNLLKFQIHNCFYFREYLIVIGRTFIKQNIYIFLHSISCANGRGATRGIQMGSDPFVCEPVMSHLINNFHYCWDTHPPFLSKSGIHISGPSDDLILQVQVYWELLSF